MWQLALALAVLAAAGPRSIPSLVTPAVAGVAPAPPSPERVGVLLTEALAASGVSVTSLEEATVTEWEHREEARWLAAALVRTEDHAENQVVVALFADSPAGPRVVRVSAPTLVNEPFGTPWALELSPRAFFIGPGQRALQVRIRGGYTVAGGGSAYTLLHLFHLSPERLSRVFAAQERFEESWTEMGEAGGSARTRVAATPIEAASTRTGGFFDLVQRGESPSSLERYRWAGTRYRNVRDMALDVILPPAPAEGRIVEPSVMSRFPGRRDTWAVAAVAEQGSGSDRTWALITGLVRETSTGYTRLARSASLPVTLQDKDDLSSSLGFDFAAYGIRPGERAFGVRLRTGADAYPEQVKRVVTRLILYREEGTTLTPILDAEMDREDRPTEDEAAPVVRTHRTLSIASSRTLGFFDLLVKGGKGDAERYRWTGSRYRSVTELALEVLLTPYSLEARYPPRAAVLGRWPGASRGWLVAVLAQDPAGGGQSVYALMAGFLEESETGFRLVAQSEPIAVHGGGNATLELDPAPYQVRPGERAVGVRLRDVPKGDDTWLTRLLLLRRAGEELQPLVTLDVEEQRGDEVVFRSKVSLLPRMTQGFFDLRVQTKQGGEVTSETLHWNGEAYE